MTTIKMGMTIEEAAECSGIGRNTMRKLVEWRKLPVLKSGARQSSAATHWSGSCRPTRGGIYWSGTMCGAWSDGGKSKGRERSERHHKGLAV